MGADAEQRRFADGPVDIEQRDRIQIADEFPAAAMAFFRSDVALVPQPGHHPAHDDGVRSEHLRDRLGGGALDVPIHMDQHMEHAGQAVVAWHRGVLSESHRNLPLRRTRNNASALI
nr:hypothetical protein X990_4591 [Burkholderia pseudomallei MSHR4868]